MEHTTSWGAMMSPDGEYWWDGSSWRPMYTPGRQHVWDGQAWQPVASVAAAPVVGPAPAPAPTPTPTPTHGVGSARPSWLPAGISPLEHSALATPVHLRGPGTAAPHVTMLLPQAARRRGPTPLGVMAILLGVLVAAGAAAGGFLYYQRVSGSEAGLPGHPSGLAAIAVQPQDIPGVKPCHDINFNQAGYINYMKQKHPDRYQTALSNWNTSKSEGLLDAWYVGYAEDTGNCDKLLTGGNLDGTSRSLLNMVFLAKDEASAINAYKQSSVTAASFGSTQKGAATGLGDDSTAAYIELGGLRQYIAIWRGGKYGALVSSGGLAQPQAKAVAQAVNSRMH